MNTIKEKYLGKLSEDFHLLSEIVLEQLSLTRSILEGQPDEARTQEIEKNELLIDGLDVKMRDEVINAILLFSPRAADLRKIMSYHNMTIYLERIGDQILNVSHFMQKMQLDSEDFRIFKTLLSKMLKRSEKMVRNAVFAFSGEDNQMAYNTIAIDDKVDGLLHEINDLIHLSFKEKPLSSQDIINITSINSVAYNIERIGDNATNIAEAAIYLVEGKDIRHGNKE